MLFTRAPSILFITGASPSLVATAPTSVECGIDFLVGHKLVKPGDTDWNANLKRAFVLTASIS